MLPQEIQQEGQAFISWISLFELSRPVTSLADLSDGAALFDVLACVDEEYFRNAPRSQSSDNWVIRFSQLKRLFRLITQYFADVLHRPTTSLEVPNLQAIAQDYNVVETLALCRLTIAIAVQGKKNSEIIAGIQQLRQSDQRAIMTALEKVMSRFTEQENNLTGDAAMTDDDHYYQIQLERSKAFAEKETLEKVYQQLLEEHRTLQTNYDDTTAERDEINSHLRDLRRQLDDRRHDKSDGIMRAEIDRLRADLHKTEENLGVAEVDSERKESLVKELTRRVEELQGKADEAVRLKDQVDEYRHAAEKLHKTENVMEKYKKKLEESADLRRHVKSLEEQNSALVDKNAALEEENRKVASYKPLMESYKAQIVELENKVSSRLTELESSRFELAQSQARLRQVTEGREKDSEALELYQERVRELELATVPRPRIRTTSTDDMATPVSEPQTPALGTPGFELDATSRGLGGELNDAITGTTTTDLKLQIRALKRDLEAARTGGEDASRVLVLESLLEDSQRMKSRYEEDYLTAHREKLVLQAQLEEIRSGKAIGDGPEAAIALRQRLNESVEQLDTLRREHAELQVKFETQSRDLTIAQSDLNLVNKDQLEILATLRESVNEDKADMESDMTRLRSQIVELKDKNKMQLEQVNTLLMEKVSLQSEGIGQRERLLERERHFGDLRASLGGKDLPEEAKAKFLALHEDNVQLKEQLKTTQEKFQKARAFIKEQDKLFKEQQSKSANIGMLEEAEENYRSQIKIIEEEVERHKRLLHEATQRYQQEQTLMLGIIQRHGMNVTRGHLRQSQQRSAPSSWLGQQRKNIGQSLQRH